MSYEYVRPSSKLTWAFDWSAFLAGYSTPPTISSRQWSVSPATGITLTGDTTANCQVEGFAFGQIYLLTETVTLSNGDIVPQAITLRCGGTE